MATLFRSRRTRSHVSIMDCLPLGVSPVTGSTTSSTSTAAALVVGAASSAPSPSFFDGQKKLQIKPILLSNMLVAGREYCARKCKDPDQYGRYI